MDPLVLLPCEHSVCYDPSVNSFLRGPGSKSVVSKNERAVPRTHRIDATLPKGPGPLSLYVLYSPQIQFSDPLLLPRGSMKEMSFPCNSVPNGPTRFETQRPFPRLLSIILREAGVEGISFLFQRGALLFLRGLFFFA